MIELEYVVNDDYHAPHYKANFSARPNRWFYIQSKTKICIDLGRGLTEFKENCAILFPPMTIVTYSACGDDELILDWFSFYADESFKISSSVPVKQPIYLPFPFFTYDIIHMLAVENRFPGSYNQNSYECLIQLLLNKLSESVQLSHNLTMEQSLIKLRMQIYNTPGESWNVEEMAQSLNISPGYLHNIYKTLFGVSCIEDVITARIDLAKLLLRENHLPIHKIADECGYQNSEHFFRQFKKRAGITPRQFRLNSIDHTKLLGSHLVQDTTLEDLHDTEQVSAERSLPPLHRT